MDSLTQLVLGASVSEAVMQNKVGRKATLWGAIVGTLPDFRCFYTHGQCS
jgi:inner membrane protein